MTARFNRSTPRAFAWRAALVLGALSAFACAGCALTQKSEPVLFRYFTAERSAPSSAARGSSTLELRLGRVTSASYIKDRIAFRDDGLEIGYYDDLRWTERPEAYLRRAVGRSLFEDQGVHQLIGGAGPTLEIELAAFEEVRAPKHVARVQLTWLLRDELAVRAQRTLTIEQTIEGRKTAEAPSALAFAMSEALGKAVEAVTAAVSLELAKSAAPAVQTSDGSRPRP